MPTFAQLLGRDRKGKTGIPWIDRAIAVDILSNIHSYFAAREEMEGADLADAKLLIKGAALELALDSEKVSVN